MDGQNEQQQTPANGHSTDPRPEQQQQHDVKQEVTDQTTEQPSQVSDEEVKQRLLVLLGKSDLSTTTEKMLRKQLEQELGADLSSKKALIRTEVMAYLEQHQPEAEEEEEGGNEEEEEESVDNQKSGKKRGGGGFGGLCLLSEELQRFVGAEKMARTQVVKSIWEYIKANDLQEPSNRRNIIIDDKLATLFTKPLTMFSMNKQLKRHVFSSSEVTSGSNSTPRAQPAKRAKKRAASDDGDDGEAGPKRKATGYCKPLPISEELAAAAGVSEMSRGELNKWLYAYVDEHNLKDPSDKRYCMSDDTLLKLTGEKRFLMFGAQKFFKDHFKK